MNLLWLGRELVCPQLEEQVARLKAEVSAGENARQASLEHVKVGSSVS